MWKLLHPKMTDEHLGFLPMILRADDPRPAREQIEERYAHGGGYHPYPDGAWTFSGNSMKFPGDPPLLPLASLALPLSHEELFVYDHALVRIQQADGSSRVTRMD